MSPKESHEDSVHCTREDEIVPWHVEQTDTKNFSNVLMDQMHRYLNKKFRLKKWYCLVVLCMLPYRQIDLLKNSWTWWLHPTTAALSRPPSKQDLLYAYEQAHSDSVSVLSVVKQFRISVKPLTWLSDGGGGGCSMLHFVAIHPDSPVSLVVLRSFKNETQWKHAHWQIYSGNHQSQLVP